MFTPFAARSRSASEHQAPLFEMITAEEEYK